MPSTYSSLLRLELMATGEKSATWGDITNTNLGTLLEKSIAGLASVNVTAGNVTLTALNGTDDESRCAIISVTGTPGVSRNVVAPSSAKLYAVLNGSNAAIVFKGAATTGVTLAAGEKAWLAWNGSDFVAVGVPSASPSFTGTASVANLSVSGTLAVTGASTFTGQAIGPSGSAAAPSFSFVGDLNNGWWAPAADTQAWSLSGSEVARLNSSGFGLGVTPARPLHVKSATQSQVRIETTTARGSGQVTIELNDPTGNKGYFGYGSANDNLHLYQGLNASTYFYTNALLRMEISSAGNVLISDPTSGTPLTVSGNGTLAALFKNSNGGTVNAGIAFGSPGSTNLSAGVAGLAQSGSTGALILQYVTGSALTEGARIDTVGQFGIGVSPGSMLDVSKGGTSVYGRFRAAAGFAAGIQLAANNNTAGTTSFDLQQDSTGNVDIVQRANFRMSFYTNNTEKLRLNADGSLYGTALHNVGTPTGTTTQYIASGTYTPTITNGANVSASTARKSQWIRVGNVVTVSVTVTTTQTNVSAVTDIGVSLPIASNLAVTYDLSGTGFRYDAAGGGGSTIRVIGDVTNDRASLTWISNTNANTSDLTATFTYEVL